MKNLTLTCGEKQVKIFIWHDEGINLGEGDDLLDPTQGTAYRRAQTVKNGITIGCVGA